jgi:sulfur-carrier protein
MEGPTARRGPDGGHVTVRYWAAARAAAGTPEDAIAVDGPLTLADLRERALGVHDHDRRLADVLRICSVLVGDRPVGSRDAADVDVSAGDVVEFLPPFAGG